MTRARFKTAALFFGACLQASSSLAAVLFPGVTGRPLIDSLRMHYKSARILTYAGSPDPRDTLFGEIYLTAADSLECVYSGYTIYMQPGQDPDDWAFANDINCEHTWPQSLLNTSQTPNPTGDMHHLFPTRQLVNADRGNSPFAEITDANTQYWYYKDIERSTVIPSSNIDGYAEVNLNVGTPSCEPREMQQGNTARAMFYMLTMYQLSDTTLSWWTGQKYNLRNWHIIDPADGLEESRTWLIAAHQQNKPNPFVIDSSLVDRCYFPDSLSVDTRLNFASISASHNEAAGTVSLAVNISSPSGSNATTVDVVLDGGTGTAADVNNYSTQTLTFPAGSSANQSASVTITDDVLVEGTETLIFKLRNASGGSNVAVGTDSTFTLTINDNDASGGPPWIYDFGTGTGSFSSGVSTTFLPLPMAGGGDSARVRIGTGGGSFNMDNPGLTNLGTDTELRAVAPTGGSVNKFSVYNYTQGKSFTIKMTVRFGGGSPGRWYFFQGDGTTYADNNTFSGIQVFTGLRWAFGASGSCTTSYRAGGVWTALDGVMASQGANYTVEIYGNNTDSLAKGTIAYDHGGTQSVASNRYDLWVDGALVGNELQKGLMPNNQNIDSWMFYGESSAGNVATIYIDDIIYTNRIASSPLSVHLSTFTASAGGGEVVLRWRTECEDDSYMWIVERSQFAPGPYAELGRLPAAGTSQVPKDYAWADRAARAGITHYYRIGELGLDGRVTYYGPVSCMLGQGRPQQDLASGCAPNPFRRETFIKYQVSNAAPVSIFLYNVAGQLVKRLNQGLKQPGWHQARWDGTDERGRKLSAGVYLYRIFIGGRQFGGKAQLVR